MKESGSFLFTGLDHLSWQEVGGSILRQLEGTNVGHNSPAIIHLDVVVGAHLTLAVGDRVENLAVGHFAILILMITGGTDEPVLGSNAIAGSGGAVTNLTIDLVSLLSAREKLLVNGDGDSRAPHIGHLSRQTVGLVRGHVKWNRAVWWNTIHPAFGKK